MEDADRTGASAGASAAALPRAQVTAQMSTQTTGPYRPTVPAGPAAPQAPGAAAPELAAEPAPEPAQEPALLPSALPRRERASLRGADPKTAARPPEPAGRRSAEQQSAARHAFADELSAFTLGAGDIAIEGKDYS